jgi:hypothetical protein
MPDEGRLVTTFTETVDGNCDIGAGSKWTWIRVSPNSPAGAAMTAPDIPAGDEISVASCRLTGIWLLEGSGQRIRFSSDGTYAVDDGGLLGSDPDDTGSYEVVDGTVTLTSAGSASCTVGDVQVWEGATVAQLRLHENLPVYSSLLRSGAAEPGCSIYPSSELTWLRLSP